MKKLFQLILAVVLFSCGNNKADQPKGDEDTLANLQEMMLWQSNLNDSGGRLLMKKDRAVFLDSLTASTVIGYLNAQYTNVPIQLERISHDTIYTSIPNATYLTQQMGSTGPMMYFAAVVYNLTEIPGIRYVKFDFEEGDHASPDVLSRESFKDQ